jgi:hypothetical protein
MCIFGWLRLKHRPPSVTPAKAGVQEVLEKPGFPPSYESLPVIPAKAGIQAIFLDSRLRGNDDFHCSL